VNATVEVKFAKGILELVMKTARLDAAVAGEIKKVCEVRWPNHVDVLMVDMAEVEFVDSSGIGALLGLYKRLPASHGAVRLLNTRRAVRSVIELLRLQKVFALD